MAETEIGCVTHYFGKIGVVAIKITKDSLKVGDTVHIKGHTSEIQQHIDSMQIDGKPVQEALPGQTVGIKVTGSARPHDSVYKITPE
jgi:putative protease